MEHTSCKETVARWKVSGAWVENRMGRNLVGGPGFEPGASRSRGDRAEQPVQRLVEPQKLATTMEAGCSSVILARLSAAWDEKAGRDSR